MNLGRKETYSEKDLLAAIEGSRGNKNLIAESLGCDRRTIYNYEDKYDSVREAIAKERGDYKEVTERYAKDHFLDAVENGDLWAIRRMMDRMDPDKIENYFDYSLLDEEEKSTLIKLLKKCQRDGFTLV